MTLEPADDGAARTQSCVEAVLRGMTWPKSGGPLATAEREWPFSTEAR